AVVEALAELSDVRLQAPQDYLDRTRIKDELLARLFDLYLIQAAAVAARPVFDAALLLGWFELRRHEADPATFQVAHLRHVVHWHRVPMLLSDPSGLLRETYGWGTPTFDADALVTRLGGALQHLAAQITRRELPAIPLARLHGGTPPAHQPQLQLFLALLGSSGPLAGEAGISIFGLPPTAPGAGDGGLGLAPYAEGGASLRLPISSTLSAGMSAQADLGSGLALVLRPGSDPVLHTGLNQPQAGTSSPGGALQLDLTLAVPQGAPAMTLLAGGGARVAATSVALVVSVSVDDGGTDVALRLQIKGARLTLTPEGLPFLEEELPTDGLVAEADLDLSWSHRDGVRLDGRAELKISRAIGRRIGPVTLDVLGIGLATEGGGVSLTAAVSATVNLGPVRLVVEQIGVRSAITPGPGSLGSADLTIRPTPPSGIGVAIDAPTIVGGGFLFFDPRRGEYGGILQLEIAETIAVTGIGLLSTRMPGGGKGYSLIVIIAAQGFAPIQLGFGFTLTGIGGLLGVNRTVLVDALRSGIKNGSLGSILFPADPIRNAPQIVSDLRAVFPPAADRFVFGPMAIVAWGTPTILTLEIALLLELPEPVRLIILGRLRAALPDANHALIQVRMDAIGVIDFNRGEIALDATLYDSRILEFALTGDMALRASWGRQPNFVLSVGGFNPRFAAPADFPKLRRLALSLGDGDNPRLRFESYLALTSNSVQFGARLDFAYSAAGFTLAGFLGFDALFQFAPFTFIADVGAMVALKRGKSVLMSVSLDMSLAGPTPWHVWGKATFKIFFFKVSIRFDHRFGHEPPPALPEPIDVPALLAEALGDRRNWSSALPRGEHPLVGLRDAETPQAVLRVHPLAELSVRQRVVPLNRPVTRFGNLPLAEPATFTVAAGTSDSSQLPLRSAFLQDSFALAQYQEMSDEQKITRPAFESQDAGLRFGADEAAYEYEPLPDATIAYETLLVDPTRPAEAATTAEPYVLPQTVLEAVASLGAAGQAAIRRGGSARYRALERSV
ncbi:MAG TPA: DUF6603 domain-containing protein, partial [Roseiflexaceae bacterium]|nr:DUF6603 domain-containing protein [Roseiflexaceae bacterium]